MTVTTQQVVDALKAMEKPQAPAEAMRGVYLDSVVHTTLDNLRTTALADMPAFLSWLQSYSEALISKVTP